MAKARKQTAAVKSKAGRRPKKPSAARANRLIKLSAGAGDPLQPAGLSGYLTAVDDDNELRLAALAGTAKASRGEALKAAQARWSSRQKIKGAKR